MTAVLDKIAKADAANIAARAAAAAAAAKAKKSPEAASARQTHRPLPMKKWLYVIIPGIMLAIFLFFYREEMAELDARDTARANEVARQKATDAAHKKVVEDKARAEAEKRAADEAAERRPEGPPSARPNGTPKAPRSRARPTNPTPTGPASPSRRRTFKLNSRNWTRRRKRRIATILSFSREWKPRASRSTTPRWRSSAWSP